jgi:hypothetical protein
MKYFINILIATIFFCSSSANAALVTLTFEGLGDFEYVRDFYNGGKGGNGSGPGTNYGVSFPGSTATYISGGPSGAHFGGQPTPTTALSFQQFGAWMNVGSGFTQSLSFYYANPNQDTTVSIYSDINGGGKLIAELFLPRTIYQDPNGNLFPAQYASISFLGTAKSVDFIKMASRGYVDDLSINISSVPIPSAIWLFSSALIYLGFNRRAMA